MKQQTGKAGRKPRRDADVLSIGRQMSNVLFNLSQMSGDKTLGEINFKNLRSLQEQWDTAVTKYRDSFKRKAVRP